MHRTYSSIKKYVYSAILMASLLAVTVFPILCRAYVPPVGPGRCYALCPEDDDTYYEPEPVYEREDRARPSPPKRQSKRDRLREKAQRYRSIGNDYYNQGNYREAYRYFKTAHDLLPNEYQYKLDCAETADKLGRAAFKRGDYQTARTMFATSLSFFPEHKSYLENLAVSLYRLSWEKWEEGYLGTGWELMQKAAAVYWANMDIQAGYGKMSAEVDRIERAYGTVKRAGKRYRKGDYEGAVTLAREAWQIRPSDPKLKQYVVDLLSVLGTHYFENDAPNKAAVAYTEAVNLDLNDSMARQNYAFIVNFAGIRHMQNGDYEQALAAFQLASQFDAKFTPNIAQARAELREQVPSPPVKGAFLAHLMGYRAALTRKEAETWVDKASSQLAKISAPFDYVDNDLLAAWVIFDWATDDKSIGSDFFERWFGHWTIATPVRRTRAEGLGITNLRPADLLQETQSADRLIHSNVPDDIKELARQAMSDEKRYRELLYNDKRFSLYVLASTMQVLHERIRKVDRDMRMPGAEWENLDKFSPKHYEMIVTIAIERNYGDLAGVKLAIEEFLSYERKMPYSRLEDFPYHFFAND